MIVMMVLDSALSSCLACKMSSQLSVSVLAMMVMVVEGVAFSWLKWTTGELGFNSDR